MRSTIYRYIVDLITVYVVVSFTNKYHMNSSATMGEASPIKKSGHRYGHYPVITPTVLLPYEHPISAPIHAIAYT